MMDTRKSAYDEFSKRRNRFSEWIVQYAIVFTVALVALLSVTYYSITQQYADQVERLQRAQQLESAILELSHRWELLSVGIDASSIEELLKVEGELVKTLEGVSGEAMRLPSLPEVSRYTQSEHIQLAKSRLVQITQVTNSLVSESTNFTVYQNTMLPVLGAGWVFLFIYLVWGWTRCLKDRKAALSFYHYQLDRRHSEHDSVIVPPNRSDEYGDFARYLDSILSSMMHDIDIIKHEVVLCQSALSASVSIKFLLNQHREIKVMSQGANELWVLEAQALSDLLEVDRHLAQLEGEVVSEELLHKSGRSIVKIGQGNFEVCTQKLGGIEPNGYLVELVPQMPLNELKVIEASLSLMANDVWDAPIRILDKNSSYVSFSNKLERTRKNVELFITSVNESLIKADSEQRNVTKLQQLSEVLIDKLEDSQTDREARSYLESKLVAEVCDSKQGFMKVREQIEQRFELYEMYFQQLVELQLAQSSWVTNVSDGLLNTKQAVLNLLTMADNGQTVSAIEHGIVDLAHDIDAVLQDILASKPDMTGLKLEQIKSSESDLMVHLNVVQEQFDRVVQLTHQSKENIVKR